MKASYDHPRARLPRHYTELFNLFARTRARALELAPGLLQRVDVRRGDVGAVEADVVVALVVR